MDAEEEYRRPGSSSVSVKDRDSTHTLNNKGQTDYMECKLNDPPGGHMRGHRLLDNIATSIA